MALIDLHCHLDLYPDPHQVAQEAAARGVYVLSVTTTPSAFRGTANLAPKGSRIRTALGLHPELAAARERELPLFEQLLSSTDYVGEVGLDGSPPHRSTLDRQAGILMEILLLCARAGGKTITLHSRGASGLILDLLTVEPLAGRAILHWFTGTPREAARASEMGCWFSVGAPMLASERGRRAIMKMPRDRVLPESDGPFALTRGRPSLPWEAMDIASALSALWHESIPTVEHQLLENFRRISLLSQRPFGRGEQ